MHSELQPPRAELKDTIFEIGRTLASLNSGALADLRRMSLDGDQAGAPYFWRLAARHDFGINTRREAWARIVQIMAILTDKGAPEAKRSPHEAPINANGYRGLGHALCDGGDLAWGVGQIDPRPMLTEFRFARLVAARGAARAELLERAVRALAGKKPPRAGVNCTDLAWLLLDPENPSHARKLARDYYARLDRAARVDDGITKLDPVTGENA